VSETTDRFNLDTYNQGDDNWSHTDTVELLDELAVETDTIANRPTSGSYDDELFFATDQRILYRWDNSEEDWEVQSGLGTESNRLPDIWIEEGNFTSAKVETEPTEANDVARLSDLDESSQDVLVKRTVNEGESFNITEGNQLIVYENYIHSGNNVDVDGELVII